MYVILVYDIAEDKNGARRQRHTFQTCKKYLTHIQIPFLRVISHRRT